VPQGHLLLESFHLDGTVPVWRFRCGGRVVEHRIWMETGADTVYAAWRLDDPDAAPAELRVTLLANARDHHDESWPAGFAPELRAEGAALRVARWFKWREACPHQVWFAVRCKSATGHAETNNHFNGHVSSSSNS
jgi:4-alpha-glucanotransferase